MYTILGLKTTTLSDGSPVYALILTQGEHTIMLDLAAATETDAVAAVHRLAGALGALTTEAIAVA